jgi:hypothetical protein
VVGMGRGVVALALGTTGAMVVEEAMAGATMTSRVDIGEQGWEWAAVIGTTRTEAALLAVDHLVLAATVPALG